MRGEVVNDMVKNDMQALALSLRDASNQTREEEVQIKEGALNAKLNNDTKKASQQSFREIEGPYPPDLVRALRPRHDAYMQVLTHLDNLKDLFSTNPKTPQDFARITLQRKEAVAAMRKMIETGANLTENEKENLMAQLPGLWDYALGKTSFGLDVIERIDQLRHDFANADRTHMLSPHPGYDFARGNVVSKVFDEEAAQKEDVRQALQGTKGPDQIAALKSLASRGNRVARDVLRHAGG